MRTSGNVPRPHGTGPGLTVLAANPLSGANTSCLDFVRSGRPRQAGDPANVVSVAFAHDAITWAATDPAKGGHAPVGASLSLPQLAAIYTCKNPGNGNNPYRWSDFFAGASNNATISTGLPTASYRVLYNVMKNAGVAGAPAQNGWICKNGAADISSYGFLPLPVASCGALS